MSSLDLSSGAEPFAVTDVAGHAVALHFGDAEAEYQALHAGAALVDRSHRGRLRVSGPKAAEMITGLVTNDVISLAAGHGLYAAALTAKGKIVADVRIHALGGGGDGAEPRGEGAAPGAVDSLLIDTPARAAAGWMDVVRKYINPRVAPYRDEAESTRMLGVYGPHARHVVSDVLGLNPGALALLQPYAHLTGTLDGTPLVVVRSPDLGAVDGFDAFCPAELAPTLAARVTQRGAAPAGLVAWDIARVEAGRPEWGIDIDDATIPQEANFDDLHAISYTKGCYTGQETVARVHFRGHVNRHLRGLRLATPDLPPARTPIGDAAGKALGEARSAALSPRFGPIAIAMVRREVTLGDTVVARWEGGETEAQVVSLPFE
jgi:folate-binding protein YgfZ